MKLTNPDLTIKALKFTCNKTKCKYKIVSTDGENETLKKTIDLVKNETLNKTKKFTRIELANRFTDVTLCSLDHTKKT
mgnify:CR=1 FL=1